MAQKSLQVTISGTLVEKIDKVKNRIHAGTTGGAIRSSIAIADMVTEAFSKGANVIIEEKDGKKYRITMPGVTVDDE